MTGWRVEFLPEAQDDLSQLDQSVRPEVLKAIRKVSQNPGYPDGYGKPLGNLAGSDLAGLYNTIRVLKSYQIWDGFFVLAKLSEGRRSNATLTEAKHSQNGKDAQRC